MMTSEELFYSKKPAFDRTDWDKASEYAEGYKTFLDMGKTERDAVTATIELAREAGFQTYQRGMSLKPGDRVYRVNREKAIVLAVIGEDSLEHGVHLTAAHLDAPRIDIRTVPLYEHRVYRVNREKAIVLAVIGEDSLEHGVHLTAAHLDAPRIDIRTVPLYEQEGMAYFKTHYYGGIKKYQWTAIPLELRGVVCVCKNGKMIKVKVCIGSEPDDPKFVITDLLTHYYGGIKKYQWTAIPLELRGVVCVCKNGKMIKVKVCIGAEPDDPKFVITDLLPHLASKQMQEKMLDGIKAENMNILIGSKPSETVDEKCSEKIKLAVMEYLYHKYGMTEADFLSAELSCVPAFNGSKPSETVDEKCSEKIKLAVMEYLYHKYGMTEADFLSAELSCVPAFNSCDIGFDRTMVGAYGHDDRVCAYPAATALMTLQETPKTTSVCLLVDKEEIGSFDRTMVGAYGHDDRVCAYPAATALMTLQETPKTTSVCLLVDKEEIGSEGVTGMQSQFFDTFLADLCRAQDVYPEVCYENSICLSTDVCNAYDPNFAEVSEPRNDARINCGFAVMKYSGARGKSETSDAAAELMARVRLILDGAGVAWQTAQLGRVDQGGGGTVAMYLAKRNIDTVDAGVPVLSMHAPFEVISKIDLYNAYLGMQAFYQA